MLASLEAEVDADREVRHRGCEEPYDVFGCRETRAPVLQLATVDNNAVKMARFDHRLADWLRLTKGLTGD